MKIRFLAPEPCIAKINGAYFGVVSSFERYAELSLQDAPFVELIPENGVSVRFFLSEEITQAPPERTEISVLKDGILIRILEFASTQSLLKPVLQKTTEEYSVTVFRQGEVQVSIQSNRGTFIAALPRSFEQAKEIFVVDKLVLVKTDDELCILGEQAKILFSKKILSFSLSDHTLSLTLPLFDRLQRRAFATYELDDGIVRRTSFSVSEPSEKTKTNEAEELLPYAFFEDLLIGANYETHLSEELKKNASSIPSFVGTFCGVRFTEKEGEIALVKKRGERLYEYFYYETKTENGKIVDIRG